MTGRLAVTKSYIKNSAPPHRPTFINDLTGANIRFGSEARHRPSYRGHHTICPKLHAKATPNNKRVHRCTIYVMAGIGQDWPGHDEGEVRRLKRENENC
jgi:hypothetical protein